MMVPLIIGVFGSAGIYLCLKKIEQMDEEESMEELRNTIEQVEFIQKVRESIDTSDKRLQK